MLFRALWRLIRGEDQRGRKVRWLVGQLRPYRGRVALMFVGLLSATAAGLAPPYLAGRAIDAGILTGDVSALDLIVVAFVAVAIVYAAATYLQTYMVGWVGTRVLQNLRQRVFAHLQSMSIGFFTRRSPGVLISRMTNDIEALNQLVTDGVVTMFSSTLTLVGVVVIMLAARRPAGPGHLPHLPAAADRQRRLPHRLRGRLPGDAGSGSPRSPPTCRRR